MLICLPFGAFLAEFVPMFFAKIAPKHRYKNVNGGMISRGCSHGFIQYFPLIARVHTRANVNKMLTEKKIVVTKVNFRYLKSQCTALMEPGELAICGVTHPRRLVSVRSLSYYTRRKVVNAKLDALSLYPPATRIENLTHKWYILPTINLVAAMEVLQRD